MRGYIRQRSKDSWTIHWDEPRGPDGKRRQRNKAIKGTKREAEARLREILSSLDKGSYLSPNKMTVRDLLNQWLDNYVEINVRPRTIEGYRLICEKHLIPHLGDCGLTKLQPAQIQGYYGIASKEGRTDGKGGLSARTINGHHRVLSEALEWGIKQGLLARNACKRVTAPRPVSKEMHVLTELQVDKLLDTARGTQYYHMIHLALYTGMRRSELLGLRWKDADMVLSAVRVTQSMHQLMNQEIVFTEPKTARSKRSVALSPGAVLDLKEHYEEQKALRDTLGKPLTDDDLVFARFDGSPLPPSGVSHAFGRLCKNAGIDGIRFHDLRHTMATMMMKYGTNPKVVQERLGHSSIAITMDVYSHVVPGMQELAALQFEEGLRRSKPAKEMETASW